MEEPYWITTEGLPGMDFSRQIVEPGTEEKFPNGAIGIYVDDDFWAVAALPLDRYRDVPLEDIVKEYWPTYVDQATYAPDHGTIEQQLYFARNEAKAERERYEHVWEELRKVKAELDRYRRGRTDMSLRNPTRLKMQTSYFVRQYENLLVAMAHPASPFEDRKGVCSVCGLMVSNRVHHQDWIDLHNAGYKPDMAFMGNYPDD